ncbi:MAG TPA: phenylalanine--tRNA ligase subunit alpha [Erysipelotrichaceae bacterium]|nr:phenylalanine--tRNA ligase subunit alpha [Erysipelotrichaceae bacterium]
MTSINDIKEKSLSLLEDAKNLESLEDLRVEILGKKGLVSGLMKQMRNLDASERPEFGQKVNELKGELESIIREKLSVLMEQELQSRLEREKVDITLPGSNVKYGNKHPLTLMSDAILDLFASMGYRVVKGPEVELDKYNFERANIPENHPAREMQDTFFVDVERLLRTHTTAIQTRVLEAESDSLPIKVICPGKTYRRDDDDATHSHQFIQIEGLLVDEKIKMTDLKGTLEVLARHLFGKDQKIRLRPSYFQFTEPSVEVDVTCFNCKGEGCFVCKQSGFIELLGAGMVHPDVLEMAGIDSKRYSGFAFGMGVDRAVMLKYGVNDIRALYTNDVRLLDMFDRFD